MKTLLFFSVLSLSLSNLCGQIEPLNQKDSNGKNHGKWTVYLDSKWKDVQDSTKAVYYRYTWYEHGANIYPMGSFKKLMLDPVDTTITAGKPKRLDGEYKWLDKNKQVRYSLVYKRGEILSYKGFLATGKITEEFEYSDLWQGFAHTYHVLLYDKSGNAKSYYMRPGELGWAMYGYKNADSVTNITLKVVGDSTFFTGKMYKNGKILREYSEIRIKENNGKVKEIRHGHIISWYSNGQKKEEGDYYYGKKNGQWKWWDENGKLRKEENYKDGNPIN